MEKITLHLDFLNYSQDNFSLSKNNTKDLKMILVNKKEEETKFLTKRILRRSTSDMKKVDIKILY